MKRTRIAELLASQEPRAHQSVKGWRFGVYQFTEKGLYHEHELALLGDTYRLYMFCRTGWKRVFQR